MYKWLNKILNKVSFKKKEGGFKEEVKPGLSPKDTTSHFNSITILEKTPPNTSIEEEDFISVIYKNNPIWVLFRCPCGCHTIISLSLQKVHNPHWTLSTSKDGKPSLYPSVWQKIGCRSHFWINDGHIEWSKY